MIEQGQAWLFWFRGSTPTARILYEPFTGCEGQIATATRNNLEIARFKIDADELRLGLDKLSRLYPCPPQKETP